MDRLVAFAISRRYLMVGLFVAVLVGGLIAFQQLNIEAYPDPTPPMVDIVTQSPGLSSEEIERYITIQTKPRKQKTEIFSRRCPPVLHAPQRTPIAWERHWACLAPFYVPIASPSSDLCLTRSWSLSWRFSMLSSNARTRVSPVVKSH